MKKNPIASPFLGLAGLVLFAALPALAQVNVLTEHNDNQRTGQNLNETVLNQSNVNGSAFGLLFKKTVDDQVYASPLVVTNVSIGGGTHNVAYVATVNNTVYAIDADNGTQYWSRNFGTPINHTQVGLGGPCGNAYNDFTGNIGIVGTPVIDATAGTMYFVAHTISGGAHTQTLHAINITTGADRASNASVVVSANGFDPSTQNQRAALTLYNGSLYIAWASYCDTGTYHGFVISYTASTLGQNAVLNNTSSGTQAGIWQAGQGLNVDSNGNLYLMTGNGTWDGTANFGESFLKLNPSNLAVEDWFTPSTWSNLNSGDTDLGSAGALLIPGTSEIVGGGKSGIFYVLNTGNMGHEVANDTQIVQEFQATFIQGGCGTRHIHGSPVYWDSQTNGPLIYVWGENDFLREFQFGGTTLNTTPFATSTMTAATCGMPGCGLSVSANGSASSSGIVWANCVLSGDANHGTVPGILRAFNANNVGNTELWDSQQNASRDSCNNFAKDGYPAVANGKVYLGSFGTAAATSGQLCVYGLLATTSGPVSINGGGGAAGSFLADTDFSGGNTASTTAAIDTSLVSNPAPQAVYQTERYGAFTYTIPGLTPGAGYNVALHFAEIYWTAAGQRQFNVIINGTQVLTNFDIFAATGAMNKAIVESFSTTASGSGQIVIQFTVGAADLPKISGIAVTANTQGTNPQINAGGGAAGSFVADTDFSGGNTASTTAAIDTSLVSNPAPQAVYQTERWGAFTYTIPGLTAGGGYNVALHFAEIYWTAAGQRQFNVIINGTQVLTNFDIFAATGAMNKAIVKSFSTTANGSGQIVIQFTVGAADQPKISGIAITSGPPPPPPNIQINSGGPAVSPFAADEDFSGGATINHANTINLNGQPNPAPAAVYQTARVTATIGAGTTFSYTIPGFAAGSSHTVRLHFCETYWTAAGQRVFNVSINGTQVLSNFDVFATAGGQNRALIESFTASADGSGQFVILFTTVTNKALVSGIEIQ